MPFSMRFWRGVSRSGWLIFASLLIFKILPAAGQNAVPSVPSHHGMGLHGILKYSSDFNHFDYVNPQAPKGGTVRLGVIGTYDSFNPFIPRGLPAAGLGMFHTNSSLLYEALTVSAADEAFSAYGLLAEAIILPPDRSWVEFVLRPEARWHDGQPVTPADVIWTFKTLMEQGDPSFRYYYNQVAQVTQSGQHSVRFDFKPGQNNELPLILGQFLVLPKHWWHGRDFSKTLLEPPLGSGPYRISSFEAGRQIEWERVQNYWGRNLPVRVGLHNFDRLRYDYYRDSSVAVEAFKGGAFDYRAENISKIWATAYNLPEIENGLLIKEEIPHARSTGMQGFVYNIRKSFFQDPKVRAALAYGFDFEWSNKTLFYGQYKRTRSYFDNSELAAIGLPSSEELEYLEPLRGQIPDSVFEEPYNPPDSSKTGGLRASLRAATMLLREAGWEIRDGNLTNTKTGEILSFELLLLNPNFERVALPIKQNFERIGVNMKIRTVHQAEYAQRLRVFDYDMIVGSWGQSLSPGNEQLEFWGSQAADRHGSRNYIGIKDPAIDRLIDLVINAPDRASLVTRVRALDRVLQWHHFVIPNWHVGYERIVYWNKFGKPDANPMQSLPFAAWWVEPDKALKLQIKQP